MKFINMKRVALTVIALLIAAPATANADTSVDYFTTDAATGNTWRWEVKNDAGNELAINDVSIHPNLASAEEDDIASFINDDAYDDFGFYYVNGERFFITEGVSAQLVGNSVTFEKDGTIVRVTITANYVDYQIYSANGTPSIEGNLGSDEDSLFTSALGAFFSTEGVDDDPMILWQTDGAILSEDSEDDVTVTTEGNELWLRHYIFAHDYSDEVTDEEYLQNFFAWALANPARMDLFTGASSPGGSVGAPAQPESLAPRSTALVYGNPNSYSDPTGELRVLINRIKGLSGSLIGWK